MKKILALILALVMALALVACGGNTPATGKEEGKQELAGNEQPGNEQPAAKIKVGFITLHDENSTYDLNFINAAKAACEKLGVDYVIKTNIPRARSATRPPATWLRTAARSSSPTASATRTS